MFDRRQKKSASPSSDNAPEVGEVSAHRRRARALTKRGVAGTATITLAGAGAALALGAAASTASAQTQVINPDCNATNVCSATFTTSGRIQASDLWSDGPITVTAVGGRGGATAAGTTSLGGAQVSKQWTPSSSQSSLAWAIGGDGGNGKGTAGGPGGAGGGPNGSSAGGAGGQGVAALDPAWQGYGAGGGGGATGVYVSNNPQIALLAQNLLELAPGSGGSAQGHPGAAGNSSTYPTDHCPGTQTGSASGPGLGSCGGGSGSSSSGGAGADGVIPPPIGRTPGLSETRVDGGGGGGGGTFGGAGGGLDGNSVSATYLSGLLGMGGAGGWSPEGVQPSSDLPASVTLSWHRASNAPVLSKGGLNHTTGHFGTWEQADDVDAAAAIPGRIVGTAAVSSAPGEAQYLAVNVDGHLFHTMQYTNGSWAPAGDLGPATGIPQTVINAAGVSATPGETQFVAVTRDGRLWHTIRHANGLWDQAGDAGAAAHIPGTITSAAAASASAGDAQFFAVTSGRLWFTTRHANGSWDTAVDVETTAQIPSATTAVSVAAVSTVPGETQVAIVTDSGKLLHTVRHADGTWQAAGDAATAVQIPNSLRVTSVAAASTAAGQAQFVIATHDGTMWRTTRYADTSWDAVSPINKPANIPNTVTAVAAVSTNPGQLQVTAVA